ncbi:MAG: hemolysin family protein [Acidimicrobiales bacterium]
MVLSVVVVVLLIAANAFFVAVEFALIAADRSKLEARAAEGSRRAQAAVNAVQRMSFHLSGAQLGITLSSLVLGFMAEPLVAVLLDPLLSPVFGEEATMTVVVALALATVFQMVAGELIPKNVAIARSEALSLALAPAARIVHGAMSPMIWLFNGSANWAVRRLGIEPQEELTAVRSLDEIEYLIRSSAETGTLSDEALQLLTRTLRFEDKNAADALVPRVHVDWLEHTATVGDLLARARETGHSRYPVCDDDLDDLVGVVDVADVFAIPLAEREATPLTEVMREPLVVPETRDLVDILDDFRTTDRKLLVVLDEHGGTAGILTLEDVVEEITGEIDDEYDKADDTALTVARPSGVNIVAGTLHPDEVADATGFEIPEGPFETIAGFVLHELGRIPTEGESFRHDGWTFEVAAMDGHRVASVQMLGRGGEA